MRSRAQSSVRREPGDRRESWRRSARTADRVGVAMARTASTSAGSTRSTPTGRHRPARESRDHRQPPSFTAQPEEHRERERAQHRIGVAHDEHERVRREEQERHRTRREPAVPGLERDQADQEDGRDERAEVGDDHHAAARVDEREQSDRAPRQRQQREESQPVPRRPRRIPRVRCRRRTRRPIRAAPGAARSGAVAFRDDRRRGARPRAQRARARATRATAPRRRRNRSPPIARRRSSRPTANARSRSGCPELLQAGLLEDLRIGDHADLAGARRGQRVGERLTRGDMGLVPGRRDVPDRARTGARRAPHARRPQAGAARAPSCSRPSRPARAFAATGT